MQKQNYYIKLSIVNFITSIRFFASFIIPFIFYYKGSSVAAVCVLFCFLTDLIDGRLSRFWHVQTFFGSLLDSASDKLFGIVSLSILAYIHPIMFIPLLFEVAIFIVNLLAYYGNKNVQSSRLGKWKMVILGVFVVLGYLIVASDLIVNALPMNIYNFIIVNKESMFNIFCGVIVGVQLLALSDYSIKAFKKENRKKVSGKLISIKEFKHYLFDTEFYLQNKDKYLREILYK